MMLPRHVPPANIADVARTCEDGGFDEVWVVEDCFFSGGLTSAAIALGATSTITVGIGILPAVVRNAAFTAMEAATLAGAFPGRVHLGIGHGVGDWMIMVGAKPASWLTSLEETTQAVRDLLHGRSVTTTGDYVQLDAVQLEFPPRRPPFVSLGVRGPKSVSLTGRIADGLILAEPTSPEYIAAARANFDEQRRGTDWTTPARLTAYSWAGLGTGSDDALLDLVTGAIRSGTSQAHAAGLDEDAKDQWHAVAQGQSEVGMDMLDRLVLRGDEQALRSGVDVRHEAGADCVVLVSTQSDPDPLMAEIRQFGAAVAA